MKYRLLFMFAVILCCGIAQNAPAQDYMVGEGDVLKINVFGHDELTTVARVSGDGSIKFPLIGQIDVGGLTLLLISDRISILLSD
jgi:polysaccharide export outer membrane protein